MAFTGKKHKGSRVLTQETVVNKEKFYKLLNEIKEIDKLKEAQLRASMFETMFNHLSSGSQKELLEWAENESWNI